MNQRLSDDLVIVKGAGDLATGVAVRLHRAGFDLMMTELAAPLAVRRTVAFAEAVYSSDVVVEGVSARCVAEDAAIRLADDRAYLRREIPVIVDPDAKLVRTLRPRAVIDGIMAKRNLGTAIDDAPIVIALGPGFTAGVDCHAVVETNRGHNLGRVIWRGGPEPDTGRPGALPGLNAVDSRVLRSPVDGRIVDDTPIGTRVRMHETIARVRSEDGCLHVLAAPFDGVLRGMLHPAVPVLTGMKIGDLDPRIQSENCFTLSDKSFAVGGGVLEALLIMKRTIS